MKTLQNTALVCCLVVSILSCKKEDVARKKQRFSVNVNCEDCMFMIQKGSKQAIVNKPAGKYNESHEIEASSGDTLLIFGYNYSASKMMDAYLYKDKVLLEHGVGHCGLNPSFFIQHIVR